MQGQYRHHPQTPQRQGQGQTPNQRRGGIGPMMSAGPHPSVPLTAAQIAAQHQAQAQADELARRRSRKPTDKALPEGIEDTTIDPELVSLYSKLRDYEMKLDSTLSRKRLDMIDNSGRYLKHQRTLRIWITNTVEDQPWQSNDLNLDSFDFSSNVEPTYRVRVEGRLLDDEFDAQETPASADDDTGASAEKPEDAAAQVPKPTYRFSQFFKSISVEFPPSGRRIEPAEWKRPDRPSQPAANNAPAAVAAAAAADFDEFTFKRNGDDNINVTINLVRHEEPERYAFSPELAVIVDMEEGTRQEAMMGIWEYIRYHGLQEDEEKRNFRTDNLLKKIITRGDVGHIPLLQEYITPQLRPLPPISIPYTIRVDEEFHKDPQPTIYDVQVTVDNPLRAKMIAFITDPGYAGMLKETAGLDDQLARLVQAVSMSRSKHSFFKGLSEDPVNFFRNWLSSQTSDLEFISGESARVAGERAVGDEWRRGGENSVWASENARESVAVILTKPKQHPVPPRQG